MSDKLNLFELEPVLLAHCLKDRLFFLKIRDHIEPEYFEDENVGKIYEVKKKFNVKYNSIPEPKTIKTMFKKKFEDKAGKYLEILDVIYDLQGTYDVEFIEESTKEFIKESKVVNALKKCIPLLEEKKFGEIHKKSKKQSLWTLTDIWG